MRNRVMLTSLSNCINNAQHLSRHYLQLLDRLVQMYLSSARAKVSFLALDPVTSTSSDKHAFFSVSSRRVLIFPSVARWHKLCPWNKTEWSACTWLSMTSCSSCKYFSWMFGSSSSVSIPWFPSSMFFARWDFERFEKKLAICFEVRHS